MKHVYVYIDGKFVPTYTYKSVRDMEVGDCFQDEGAWLNVVSKENHSGTIVVRVGFMFPVE